MSETEVTPSVPDTEEVSADTDDHPEKPENENEVDNAEKEELKSPETKEETKPTEPEIESAKANNKKEADKKSSDAETPSSAAVKTTVASEQSNKPGECNLLPVLVERLRSALELSCSSQSSEDHLPVEDSGIDSEEDLRMWASGLCSSIENNNHQNSPKQLDLKFLEDLLLSDIQTALSRLQDTLKRVNVNTLTKYNSTLDSTNKLYLLRLISKLLSKLKIPEELTASETIPEENGEKAKISQQNGTQKRRRANRHTIGVSAEEIAHARRLLDEQNLSCGVGIADSTVQATTKAIELTVPLIKTKEKLNESNAFVAPPAIQPVIQPPLPPPVVTELKSFEQVRDKHVKDAINQQQTYYNKNKEFYKENSYFHTPIDDNISGSLNRVEIPYKDDENFASGGEVEEYNNQSVPSFYQQPIASKYNKFVAKKSKIKRANTIDIPNYLKLQAENFGQNQSISLRRPIDIGDKNLSSNTNIIPAFKPKTDNDRKFLALINKNNDTAASNSNLPFKSFNYRQPANIDKNWNSRFSNIKTTFDKQPSHIQSSDFESERKMNPDSSRRSQSGNSDSAGESEGVVVGSLRLSYAVPSSPKQKPGGFTHAPTSPFQRIEKSCNKNENTSIFKSGYLPKGGNSLQDKVKIFNQDQSTGVSSVVAQNKNKFNKISDATNYGNVVEQKPGKINQHGHWNYNAAYRQKDSNKIDSKQDNTMRSAYLPENRNVISSKLIVNATVNDESQHMQPKTKTQHPYPGYPSDANHMRTDKISSNDDRGSYNQYQSANYYPDKLYSGYGNQQKNIDVPVRTTSHSFMLQKIANQNNCENKPRVNRYLNDALQLKDDKEIRTSHQPLTIQYGMKPAAVPIDKYSTNSVPPKTYGALDKNSVLSQNYSQNVNSQKSSKSSSQDYSNKPKSNAEYKPIQAYPIISDGPVRANNVSHQANTMQDNKLPLINTVKNYATSYDKNSIPQYSSHQTSDGINLFNIQIQPDSNYTTQSFPRPSEPPSERYAVHQMTNDTANQHHRADALRQPNPLKDVKNSLIYANNSVQSFAAPSETSTDHFEGRMNSDEVKTPRQNQNEANFPSSNRPTVDYRGSNYVPYESYQSKKLPEPIEDQSRSYNESNYYNNPDLSRNERLRSHTGNPYNKTLPNQTASYNPIRTSGPRESSTDENNCNKGIQTHVEEPDKTSLGVNLYDTGILEDENIQNQDISSDGIVTRYQCAIATVATTPESSEADISEVVFPNPKLYNLNVSAYPIAPEEPPPINAKCNSYDQDKPSSDKSEPINEIKDESADAFEEIQRHNLLQQQIIQKLQDDENSNKVPRRRSLEKFKWEEKSPTESERRFSYFDKFKHEDRSPTSQSSNFPFNKINTAQKQVEEPVIESNNTLEKINIFEEKSHNPPPAVTRQRFRPLSIPKFNKPRDFPAPKINVVSPSKVVQKNSEDKSPQIIGSSTNICDSSDEYLMSCANRQSRSIVLSKSESWHQLALSRGNLQLPEASPNPLLKPPKPKSPASLKLSKQYEASSSSDNMKKMEEKIQRYFHSPTNISATESSNSKRESKSKRHFSTKKYQSGLARSQTMPHLYDEKLLDESTDVEKAFDSLFKEATKSDNRY